jgi:hypothetical protein
VVRTQINGGEPVTSGNLTQAEADALIIKLNEVASSRPLPDQLKPVQDFTPEKRTGERRVIVRDKVKERPNET